MGLDSYASRTPGDITLTDEDRSAFEAAGIELCGGMFSGGDASSFRGKVYLDVVDRVAAASLTADWLPPEEVAGFAAAFDRADPDAVAEASSADHYAVTAAEVRSLRAFFDVCAERRLGLIGWY